MSNVTKEQALNIVKSDGRNLKNLPNLFKADKEIILESVKQNGMAL